MATVDLLSEPGEKAAEHYLSIERISGKPHVIRGVKLERYDLDARDAGGARGAGGDNEAAATQPG